MKTFNAVVIELGEKIFRNSVESILLKKLRLEHRAIRDTKTVKEIKNLQSESRGTEAV